MALVSPRVRSIAVEAQEFPELARRYEVSAVPKIVLHERVEFMGAVPEPMFLEAVLAAVSGGDGAGAAEIQAVEPAAAGWARSPPAPSSPPIFPSGRTI